MRRSWLVGPRRGAPVALCAAAAAACWTALPLAVAQGAAAPAPASAPASAAARAPVDALRVHGVADRLIGFLQGAGRWVQADGAASGRVPLGTLRPTVQAAVREHPEVRLAGEQRTTAGFASREAFAAYLPQVALTVDGGQRHNAAVRRPWTQVPAYNDDSRALGLTVRQMLYDFGAAGHKLDAQRTREAAAEARAETRLSELALRAVGVWHEVFRARQQQALAEVNRLSRQQMLAFIKEREQLGGSSASDVLRVQARVSDADAIAVAAESRLRAAESAYREVFNAAPPGQLPLPEVPAVDLVLHADAEALLRRNPQFAEALALSDAAGQDARASAAGVLPSLHLQYSATRRDIGGPGVAATDQAYGLVVQHNFYTGGADTARVGQVQQRAVEARLEVDGLRRQLDRALQQATADVRTSDALVLARADAVRVASAAFEAVREQFAFRRGTLLDLLRAQEDLYLAGRDLIDGVVDHAQARYRLLHLGSALTPLLELSPAAAATLPK